ncbi:MAG: hypothetical protein GX326_05855 [Clostridiaceae bacterium]|nr:hypothetical protein [Clostridiaceae bacterium]
MFRKITKIHQKPDFHFSICSNNKELFSKFEEALRKNGMVGLPDLQGNLHYIVDGRKGFPTAFKTMKTATMQLMESHFNNQNQIIESYQRIADQLITKYDFDQALIGTKFIYQIIIYCLLDKSLLISFSKNLYPTIGKIFQSSPEKVSYSVRYAFKKLEQTEREQKANNVKRDYFFDDSFEGKGNRFTIYKLVKEAESLVNIKNGEEIKKGYH